LDLTKKNFFNLIYDLSPLPESAQESKKQHYEKLKIEVMSNYNLGYSMPVGNEENLLIVKDETIVESNPNLIKALQHSAQNIKSDIENLTEKHKNIEVLRFLLI